MYIVVFGSCENTTSSPPANTTVQAAEAVGITFHEGNWESALAKAKKENKLIFLDVSASWCGPCKRLKKNTFPDERVGNYFNENFISVEVDGEIGEGVNLVQQYRVEGYPSLFFINGDGEVITKTMGFLPPSEFIKFGKSVLKK